MNTNPFPQLKPTPYQQACLNNIVDFLNGHANCFILKGYAGTGKTFLMQTVITYLRNINRNFRLMAPTGRAAMVLAQRTKCEATTIHRAIYNLDSLEDNPESYKPRFALATSTAPNNTVFIVDEASMVSDTPSDDEFFIFGSGRLLNDLIQFGDFKNRNGAQIIFVGDDAQLPPVGSSFSPALDAGYLRQKWSLDCQEFQLNQVIRQQEGNSVLTAATHLRDSLQNGIFNRFQLPASDSVFLIPQPNFIEQYQLTIANSKSTDQTIVITHANRQALDYNLQIRQLLGKPATVAHGDRLMITRNCYNYAVDLFNGMFVEVVTVAESTITRNISLKVHGGKTVVPLIFRAVELRVSLEGRGDITIPCLLLDDFLTDPSGSLHPHVQQALYVDFKIRHSKLTYGSSEFKEAIRKDPYFNAVQAKYGYAITCHKSQGGEWANVFVDFDVYMGRFTSSYFRWCYTALTRTSKNLLVIGNANHTPFSSLKIKPIEQFNRLLPEWRFTPAVDPEPGEDTIFATHPFLKVQYNDIIHIANLNGMEVSISHNNWVERYRFSCGPQTALLDIHYGSKGLTGNIRVISTNAPAFAEKCLELCNTPIFHPIVYQPHHPHQRELYNWMLELTHETGLTITNIRTESWCDKYYLKSDAPCALVEFWYDGNGRYTTAHPKSMMGNDDRKLLLLVDKLA